jgi:hypothetical protein
MEFMIITVYKLSFHINQWKELVCWKYVFCWGSLDGICISYYIHKFVIHHLSIGGWIKRMELIEVKSLIWAQKGKLYIIYENVDGICISCEVPSIADTTLGISEQYLFFCHQTGMVGHWIHITFSEEYFYFPHLVVWGRYCACEIVIANPIDWLFAACLE